jgi:hypothetical protein
MKRNAKYIAFTAWRSSLQALYHMMKKNDISHQRALLGFTFIFHSISAFPIENQLDVLYAHFW